MTNFTQYDTLKAKATRSSEEDAVVKAFDAVKQSEQSGANSAEKEKATKALEKAQEALVEKPSTTA